MRLKTVKTQIVRVMSKMTIQRKKKRRIMIANMVWKTVQTMMSMVDSASERIKEDAIIATVI